MRFGQDVLSDPRGALSLEWLLANGIGGSALGTAAALPHGWAHAHLIVSGPHGRLTSLLLGMEERLLGTEGGIEPAGGTASSAGAIASAGARLGPPSLEEFRLDPWPVWIFRAGGTVLEKRLFLLHAHHAVALVYRLRDGPAANLVATPLLTARDPWGPSAAGELGATVQTAPGRVRIEIDPRGPALSLWHDGAFMPARARRRLAYEARGTVSATDSEEALNAGHLEARLPEHGALHVIVSTEDDLFRALAREDRLGSPPPRTLAECVAVLEQDERARRDAWHRAAFAGAAATLRQAEEAHHGAPPTASGNTPLLETDDPLVAAAAEAVRLGLVVRAGRLTLVGSLPKAEVRGEPSLRALRGLITLRRFQAAREILESYVGYLDEGLAPGSFDPDDGTPRYEDPAAALWLVIVGELYVRRSEDDEFARSVLLPALEGVLHHYRSGTRLGIRVDADGLLVIGEGDASRARSDLNALWYHASIAIAQLARAGGRKESGAFHLAWAHQHQRRFNEALWDEKRGCLLSALSPRGGERGLAPSQLLAVGLPPALLAPDRAHRLVGTIEEELFTPYGLREAPRADSVGTGWSGLFYSSYLRANGRSAEAQARVRAWLEPMRALVARGLCSGIPEGFALLEGGPRPVGDPVSVPAAAELLRVWLEELDHAEVETGAR